MTKPDPGINNVGKPAGLTAYARLALQRVHLIDHKNARYIWAAVSSIAALGIAAGLTWLGVETGIVHITLAGLSLIILVELFWAVAGIVIGCKLIWLLFNDYRTWRRGRPHRGRPRTQ